MTYTINNTAIQRPLQTEILDRGKMALFMLLTYICAEIILKPIKEGHTYFTVISLFEVSAMVTMALWFGGKNITRDINELNFYALMAHLVNLPANLYGVSSIVAVHTPTGILGIVGNSAPILAAPMTCARNRQGEALRARQVAITLANMPTTRVPASLLVP